MNHPTYIVLCPGMRTNTGKQHAVVHVEEWRAITLGEKESYDFFSPHTDYEDAAAERDGLNRQQGEAAPAPLVYKKTGGVTLSRSKVAATSPTVF